MKRVIDRQSPRIRVATLHRTMMQQVDPGSITPPLCPRRNSTRYGHWAGLVLTAPTLLFPVSSVLALPPAEDTPEEILRTEIIIEARSPIDGKPLTAAEYAELQAQLRTAPPQRPEVAPVLRKQIGLLRLRKFIKTFFPFLPIK